MPSPKMQITLGNEIDDRYELVEVIGKGGFAVVYKARQKQLDRIVAIKVLNSEIVQDSENLARFEREANTMSALKHRNICSLYGFGRWQEAPYMVMEYVQGKSLETLLEQEAPLEPKRAIRLIRQVLDGLSCAHKAGIIHRDLKPSNIIVTDDQDELPRIIDFGLAKLMPGYGVTYQRLTESGYAIGTVHYMSPEQCTGEPVDQRADIYAVGCILYQCLTGSTPFTADDGVALMFQQLNEPAPQIAQEIDTGAVYRDLNEFIQKCMAKDPGERFPDAETAATELEAIVAHNKDNLPQARAKPKANTTNGGKPASSSRKKFPPKVIFIGVSLFLFYSLAIGAVLVRIFSNSPDSVTMCDRYLGTRSVTDLKTGEGFESMKAILKQFEIDHKLDDRRASFLYRHVAEQYARNRNVAMTQEYADKWLSLQKNLTDRDQAHRDYDTWVVVMLAVERRWDEAIAIAKRNQQQSKAKEARQWEDRLLRLYVDAHQTPKAIESIEKQLADPAIDLHRQRLLLRQVANLKLVEGNYSEAEKILKSGGTQHTDVPWQDLIALSRSSLAQRRYAESADFLKQAEARRMEIWGRDSVPSYNILILKIAASAATADDSRTQSLLQSELRSAISVSDQWNFINDFDERQCTKTLGEFSSKETLDSFNKIFKNVRHVADKYGNRTDAI